MWVTRSSARDVSPTAAHSDTHPVTQPHDRSSQGGEVSTDEKRHQNTQNTLTHDAYEHEQRQSGARARTEQEQNKTFRTHARLISGQHCSEPHNPAARPQRSGTTYWRGMFPEKWRTALRTLLVNTPRVHSRGGYTTAKSSPWYTTQHQCSSA